MKYSIVMMLPILLASVLGGCGTNKANVSIKSMVNNKAAITAEKNWCAQQRNFGAGIQGCMNAEAAAEFTKDPGWYALVNKPEPWPGKSTAFFQAAVNAHRAAQVAEFAAQLKAQRTGTSYQPPVDKEDASEQEGAWCSAQYTWKTGDVGSWFGPLADMSAFPPACAANQKVVTPGFY